MASRRNCLPVCRRHARRYRTKKYCQEPWKSRWQYVYALAKAKARQSVHCLLRTVFHLKIHIRRWLVSHVNHPPIHPSLQPLASLSFYLSLSATSYTSLLPSCPPLCPSFCLSTCVSRCLSAYPSTHSFVPLYVHHPFPSPVCFPLHKFAFPPSAVYALHHLMSPSISFFYHSLLRHLYSICQRGQRLDPSFL